MARKDVNTPSQTARPEKGSSEKEAGEAGPEEKTLSTAETIQESAVSHDKPMERNAPQAPFALVGLAYLAVLAIVGLIIGIVLFALG